MQKILIVLFLLWTSVAMGTDYYVRPSGGSYGSENGSSYANAWDGFSNIDWEKVDSGNGALFVAGTHTGSTLTIGASGEDGSPIHIASCTKANGASIDDPGIINGAAVITGWSVHSGNIYKATVDEEDGDDEVFQVFDGDDIMLLAHEPDTGDNPNGKAYFQADSAEANRWVVTDSATSSVNMRGAYLCIKPAPWFWLTYKISSQSNNTINLYADGRGTNSSANAALGDYYFLLNHIDYLDEANEWFHDESTNTLYISLFEGANPYFRILATRHLHGIVANNRDWITIKDLEIRYVGGAGIYINNSDNYVVDGNKIHHCGSQKSYSVSGYSADKNGYNVYVSTSSGGIINNNTIDGALKSSIRLEDGDKTTISNNAITNSGLFGKGNNCPRGSEGAIFTNYQSEFVTVRNNTVKNIGYHGITFYGPNTTVNQNFVYNAANVVVDSGGIYCWGQSTDGSKIINNIILKAGKLTNDTNGIYLDDGSESVTVENNTIVGPTLRGIFLHNTKDCTVRYNKIYDVHRGILFKEDGRRPYADYMTGNTVSDNQILLISKGGNAVQWKASRGNTDFGTITNNLYSSNEPLSAAYEYYFNSSGVWQWTNTFSLSEWQNERGRDRGTVWRDQKDTAPAEHNSLILYNETSNPKIFRYNDYAYDNRSYIYFDTEISVSWPITIGASDSKILLWDGGGLRKTGSVSQMKNWRIN